MATLKVGTHTIDLIPIKSSPIKLDMGSIDIKKPKLVDEFNKEVVEVTISSLKKKKVYVETKKECALPNTSIFKSYNGEPVDKFEKTKQVNADDIEQITKSDADNLVKSSNVYLVVDDDFKKEVKSLDEQDKLISFDYSNGNGFKGSTAVVSYKRKLDKVIMTCFEVDLRKVDLTETIKTQVTSTSKPKVKRLSLKDLKK